MAPQIYSDGVDYDSCIEVHFPISLLPGAVVNSSVVRRSIEDNLEAQGVIFR